MPDLVIFAFTVKVKENSKFFVKFFKSFLYITLFEEFFNIFGFFWLMMDLFFVLCKVLKHLWSHFLMKLLHPWFIVNLSLSEFLSCYFTFLELSSQSFLLISKKISPFLNFSFYFILVFIVFFFFLGFHFFSSINLLLLSFLFIVLN